MPKGFCTVDEAAEALGVSSRRVRQILAARPPKGAVKVGKMWLIPTDREGLPKIELNRPGRPAKGDS